MSKFRSIPQVPEDPIYGLQVTYKSDPRKEKINLSIGVFLTEAGKSYRFSAVDKAEEIVQKKHFDKGYLPIDGLKSYAELITDLLLGEKRDKQKLTAYTAQTVGGTGALHVAAKFLKEHISPKIFIPEPTWVNHRKLFEACGLDVISYPYLITADGGVDIPSIVKACRSMPENSIICLQASCHNPTGIDPTDEEWALLSQEILKRKLIPLFDIAYQGIGRGLEEDTRSIRLFYNDGHEMFIASSFSKNFGLYNERIGSLTVVCQPEFVKVIEGQTRKIIRSIYSSPPAHGAYIIHEVLSSPALRKEWEDELKKIVGDLKKIRVSLYELLKILSPHSSFEAILKSTGLFTLCDLSREKILSLRDKKGLYLTEDGRINLAAIHPHQLQIIAEAIVH
jgi:aspartate/tyrosine/aromatic aminotransferase